MDFKFRQKFDCKKKLDLKNVFKLGDPTPKVYKIGEMLPHIFPLNPVGNRPKHTCQDGGVPRVAVRKFRDRDTIDCSGSFGPKARNFVTLDTPDIPGLRPGIFRRIPYMSRWRCPKGGRPEVPG